MWQSLMYAHTESEMAVKIGRAGIKDICIAAGITEAVTDHQVFVGKMANIRIATQEDKRGDFPDRNVVRRVSKPAPPKPGYSGRLGTGELDAEDLRAAEARARRQARAG